MIFCSSCVGIDLRSDTIKAAYLIRNGNRIKIKSLYQMANPLGKTIFSEPKEQSIIEECLKTINKLLPCKNVVMGVSSNNIIFRHVQLPLLSKKELREAIFWEAQEFSNIFNDNFVSDYEILDKQKNDYRMLLVGARSEMIKDYIKVANEAGISLSALDVYPLAHARVLKTQKISSVIAVVDLEPSHSEITIIDNGKIIFIRSLDFCYTKSIQNKIIDSFNDNIKDVTQQFQNLILELSRCIKTYFLQSKGSSIDEIIIIGKGSELQYLKDVFSQYFEVKVSVEKKLKFELTNGEIKVNHNLMDFFSAIGFALRGRG